MDCMAHNKDAHFEFGLNFVVHDVRRQMLESPAAFEIMQGLRLV